MLCYQLPCSTCSIECPVVSVELDHGVINSLVLRYIVITLQVMQLLQSFSLYTEHLDRLTPVKPDVDNRTWLLTADRTPYSEGDK